MLVDSSGFVVGVNGPWRQVTGLCGEDIHGRPVASMLTRGEDWGEVLRLSTLGRGKCFVFSCPSHDGDDVVMKCQVVALACDRRPQTAIMPALVICDEKDDAAGYGYGPGKPSLRSTEERYRVLFENAPLGVFTSTNKGRFINVNIILANMLGYASPEEVLENVGDIAEEIYAEPDRRHEIVQIIRKNPGLAQFENRYRRRDGSEFIGFLNVTVLQDPDTGEYYLLGMVEDITERKRAESALRESEEQYHSIFLNAPVGVYQSLMEGRYMSVNPMFASMHGYDSPSDVLGSVSDIGSQLYVLPEKRREMLELLLEQGQVTNFEVESRRKDGSTFWSSRNVRLMRDEEGKPHHIKGFLTDISKQKELDQLREDVERITRHDLKSPLMSMILGMRMMQKESNLFDRQRDILHELELSGNRMLAMINLSLDLYKMETGTYALEPEPLDLLRLVRGIAQTALENQRRKNLHLRVLVEGETPLPDAVFMLEGEELLCYSMFNNLLQNAAEASPPEAEVTVSMSKKGEWAEVEIHNMGVVPESIRSAFFEKYSTAGKSGGTGLGTYSARRIAQTHKGDIGFSTSEAEGTTLTVRLPLRHSS